MRTCILCTLCRACETFRIGLLDVGHLAITRKSAVGATETPTMQVHLVGECFSGLPTGAIFEFIPNQRSSRGASHPG